MVFASMEGKLHLYEHGHQIELHALKNVVQTPLDGLFDHEICCAKLSFDTLGCNKALALLGCIHSWLMAMFILLLQLLQLYFITFITFMHQDLHTYYTCLNVMFTI